jgi:S1-C subfamily serine protease
MVPEPSDLGPAATPSGDQTPPGPLAAPRHRWRRRRLLIAGVIGVFVAALVALFSIDAALAHRPTFTSNDINSIANQDVKGGISHLQSQPPTAATVYKAVRDGLVVVEALGNGGTSPEDFGSGVIINAKGEILTALHVVQNGSGVAVTFADGTTSAATVTSSDPAHDIAVLTPNPLPHEIVPAVLGGSEQVGSEAFVVANPLGLESSLTAGVISGLDRSFTLANGRTLTGMIQIDAAVNPGSSGGPVLNAQGQVIGIVTGLVNSAGEDAFAGIGFAVPISSAGGAAGIPQT